METPPFRRLGKKGNWKTPGESHFRRILRYHSFCRRAAGLSCSSFVLVLFSFFFVSPPAFLFPRVSSSFCSLFENRSRPVREVLEIETTGARGQTAGNGSQRRVIFNDKGSWKCGTMMYTLPKNQLSKISLFGASIRRLCQRGWKKRFVKRRNILSMYEVVIFLSRVVRPLSQPHRVAEGGLREVKGY